MSTKTMRKLGISLLAGAMGLSFSVFAKDEKMSAQGLYSAENLIGAEVFDAAGEEVGNVEDILLGNDMGVYALVIQTNEFLGIGERDVVAKRGSFTVRSEDGASMFGDVNYNVHMTVAGEEVKGFDEYSEKWWDTTQQSMNEAWESTKNTTMSAWENTKEATASAWHNTMQGIEEMGDEAEQASDDAVN